MSYEGNEHSVAAGEPVELYDFADDANQHWRYTSADMPVVHLGYEYSPVPCSRKEVEITGEHFKNLMEVRLPRNNAFAVQFIPGPPESRITLTIYRLHGDAYIHLWAGEVKYVVFDADGLATVSAEPKTSTLPYTGKRRRGQIMCDHALYDAGCKVNAEAFKVTGTLSIVSGGTLTSSVFATEADGYFAAGMIVVGRQKRLIKSHIGSTVVINRPLLSGVAGMSFIAYAGCDHMPDTCHSVFNNKINYGGQEYLPVDNPFGSKAIS